MTTLLFRGQTAAEDMAMRAWLKKQGVAVDQYAAGVDTAVLEKAGIDLGKLENASRAAGLKDGFDLASLTAATAAPSAGVLDRQARELSALAKTNLLTSAKTAMTKLAAERGKIEDGQISSRAELSQLATRLGSINQQLFKLTWDERDHLAFFDAAAFVEVRSVTQAFLAEVASFAETAGRFVEAHGADRKDDAERLKKGVSECQSAIHVVARDAGSFVAKSEILEKDLLRLRETAVEFAKELGHDAAWFDAHFEISAKPSTFWENNDEATISTKGHFDIDWSNRGLSTAFHDSGDWREHDGNLDLSHNELIGPWGLPSHVTGNLDLSHNAYDDLRAFDMHSVRVDGNVDLSHNPNLRDLSELQHLEVGGDLILIGIPATSLEMWHRDSPLKIGGDIVLHPSQVALIEDCKRAGVRHRVADDPEYRPFQKPADPEAWIVNLTWDRFPGERDLLAVLHDMKAFGDGDVKQKLSDQLAPRVLDPDPNVARAAIALLGRLDRDRSKEMMKPFFEQVPADHRAPLPPEIAKMSAPLMGFLFRELYRDERFEDRETKRGNKPPYPAWGWPLPKSERLALELVRRAEAGEAIPLGPFSRNLSSDGARSRDADSILPEASVAVVAAQLREVVDEKNELRLVMKSGSRLTLEEAFGEFKLYGRTFDAFERNLRRHPDHAPLLALYDKLRDSGIGDVIYVGREQRIDAFLRELDARRAPSPAFRGALELVHGLSSKSTPAEVERALDRLVKNNDALSGVERGAVLADLVTLDLEELRHHPAREVRFAWANAAAKLVAALPAGHGEVRVEVFERFMEHFANAPEAAREHGLDRSFVDALLANPSGSSRGYFVALHAGTLGKTELGKSMLERFFDATIDIAGRHGAPDAERQEAFKALERVSNCLIPTITKERGRGVAERLRGLELGGDLAYDRDKVLEALARFI